ncbi:unnamed protein product [Nezara viridula]|uniref:Uncharacterized protein n=1 Tax=Nezara viridula TaxID=85310 RepID=A0A9P0E2G6_NEZVI|nr:unnamed protein product [Nezara viridula]
MLIQVENESSGMLVIRGMEPDKNISFDESDEGTTKSGRLILNILQGELSKKATETLRSAGNSPKKQIR